MNNIKQCLRVREWERMNVLSKNSEKEQKGKEFQEREQQKILLLPFYRLFVSFLAQFQFFNA